MNAMLAPAFLFGTGLDEWAVLGAICFLLFGPKRLPEIARTLGRTLEKLRRAADDFRAQIARMDEPAAAPPAPSLFAPPPTVTPLPTQPDVPPVPGETRLLKSEPERQVNHPSPAEPRDKG